MSNLSDYIDGKKKRDPEFAENYYEGFLDFKHEAMLCQNRKAVPEVLFPAASLLVARLLR